MRTVAILLLGSAVASCTAVPPAAPSAHAQAKLSAELAGRVAGQPVSCLSRARNYNTITIDENTLLFRSGGTIYRNELPGGGCSGLGSGNYALVTSSTGMGLCRGDIAKVADLQSGAIIGSCAFGDFIPYTRR